MSLSKSGGGISLMAMEDSTGLSLRDGKGKARAVVQVTEDSAEIVLKNQQEETVLPARESK